MDNYDSIYSIALAISIKAEIEPINYDSTYSIAKAIYAKLGGTETAFDSTYSIVYAIYLLQGGTEQHFDSTYSILVAIDKLLGGTGEHGDSYSVLLDILDRYSPVQYFTVTYIGNGGEGSMTDPNSPYESGSTVTILGNSYTKEGYTFESWNTAADGSGTEYSTGSTFTITGDTTLYAQWEEIPSVAYVTFKGLSDGSTVGLNRISTGQTLEYSTDTETWVGMTTATTINLNTNDEVYVRGILSSDNSYSNYTNFKSTGSVNLSGNLNNLWDYENNGSDLQLKVYCGRQLFQGCSGMTFTNISLPSQNLANYCYWCMFKGCAALTIAPALPATTLNNYCYQYMFQECTSLTTAPIMSATSLASSCCNNMFKDCTSLTTAPELPATTLASSCYNSMFIGCTSLTVAPELPATTLASSCYRNMFQNCTSLTVAPELPATTLASSCYNSMFQNCTSLSSITCYAEDITASQCTSSWVDGVSSTGYFSGVTTAGWTMGNNGVPTGWNTNVPGLTVTYNKNGATGTQVVEHYYIDDTVTVLDNMYTKHSFEFTGWNTAADGSGTEYATGSTFTITGSTILYAQWEIIPMTLTAQEANSTVGLNSLSSNQTLEYSTDGSTWTNMTTATTITLANVGDEVKLRGTLTSANTSSNYTQFKMTGKIAVSDYLNAILNATTGSFMVKDYACYNMFKDCASLTAAPILSSVAAKNCYNGMFQGCTSLTTAPALPCMAISGYDYCYANMFYGCTSLTTAPTLPSNTLAQYCYNNMFRGCTSLTKAPALPATTLEKYCYAAMFKDCTNLITPPPIISTASMSNTQSNCCQSMFENCISLTTAPELPCTAIAGSASYTYSSMFKGCTSLTTAPALPATTVSGDYCYQSMFEGCTALTKSPVLPAESVSMYTYSSMFKGCTNLTEITCLLTSIKTGGQTSLSWVQGVAATGTFYKATGMSSWTTGTSGIPSGWTVEDYQP